MTKTDDNTPQLSEWGQISKTYLEQKKEMELSYHEVEDSELEALVEEVVAESITDDVKEEVSEAISQDADEDDTADGTSDEAVEAFDLEEAEVTEDGDTQESSETDAGDEDSAEVEEDEEEPSVDDEEEALEAEPEAWEEPLEAPRYSNDTVIKAGLVSVVAILTLFFSVFSITPLGSKKNITISGADHVTIEQVMADTGIKETDYLLTVLANQNRYRDNLKRLNPWVKDVSIQYQFPFGFTFNITEEEVVAYGQTVDGLKPILANGLRLSSSGKTGARGHFITVEFDNEAELKTLAKELAAISPELRQTIQFISYETKGARSDLLLLEMTDGHSVRVPLAHLSAKLPFYEKIAPRLTETSIVDMEVGIYVTTQLVEDTKVAAETQEASEGTDGLSTEEVVTTTDEIAQ